MNLEIISDHFLKYAREQGNPYKKIPLGTEIDEFGGPYIEISETGKMAIVARDRGEECFRRETTSPSLLAKWVYELFNDQKL